MRDVDRAWGDTPADRRKTLRYRRDVFHRLHSSQRVVLVIGWGLTLAVLASASGSFLGSASDGRWVNGYSNSRLVEITVSYQALSGEVPLEVAVRWLLAVLAWVGGALVVLQRPSPPAS